MKKSISYLLAVIFLCAVTSVQSAVIFAGDTAGVKTEQKGNKGEWRQLFNGKDLVGWKHVGGGSQYVEDGLIKSHGGMGLLPKQVNRVRNGIPRKLPWMG